MPTKMRVDAELIHNWPSRYANITNGLIGELKFPVRVALMRAHLKHNHHGADAQQMAVEVAAQFPDVLDVEGETNDDGKM